MKIIVKNASVSFGVNEILSGVDFEVNEHDKIAIVGRNGCGKTTLLKLICGGIDPDKSVSGEQESEISIPSKMKIGYLEQISFEDENATLEEEVLKIFSDVIKLKDRLQELEKELEKNPSEKIVNEYIATEHNFELKGGYTLEKDYSRAIDSFGFSKEERKKKLCEFSGGQKTKIALIKLLFSKPDVLILDEPTNHLDVDAVRWLEEYLISYSKAVIVVSHDRAFLDAVANIVVEIENKTTHRYVGNYSAFVKEKKESRERQQKQHEKYLSEVQKLQAVADRFRYKATKASMAQSKLKQIERMEEVKAPEREDVRPFRFNLKCDDSSLDVVKFDKLKYGYNIPLGELSAKIYKGDRVSIVGGNGLGKSTLLKTLMGKISPLGGKIKFGQNLNIGYFDQQTINLIDSEETVLDSFLKEFPLTPTQEARRILGGFLFTQEDVFKHINSLSGGERVRLELAKIFNRNPNFLVLDEPTNHLDILGRETLEDILLGYKGTVIFVSHDRYFVNKLATGIISLSTDGCKYFANTTYAEFLKAKPVLKQNEVNQSVETEEMKPSGLSAGQQFKQNKENEKKILKLERAIKRIEEEIANINKQYEAPENCSNAELLMTLTEDLNKKEIELNNLMTEWLEIKG